MILSLRRKRRITLPSIVRPTWAETCSASLALLFLFSGAVRTSLAADALSELRYRSSEQRWGRSAPPKDALAKKAGVQVGAAKDAQPAPPTSVERETSDEPGARISLEDLAAPPRPVGDPFGKTKQRSTNPFESVTSRPQNSRLQRVSQLEDAAEKDAVKPLERPAAIPSELAPEPSPTPFQRVNSPNQLKKISAILPFADYEPDPKIAATDPCLNQCPTPAECASREGYLCPEELWEPGYFEPRAFPGSCFAWAASNIWYNPLYFQDVALERYGHSWCEPVQPFVSVGKFGLQLVALPYQMGIDPICKKEYALGYYRPGDCAPKLCYQPPLSVRGALAEAGVVTGLFFIIP